MTSLVYPELVRGRADDEGPGPWRVRAGTSQRGGASCNVRERILEVPLEADERARVVRAHELTHARVSPTLEDFSRSLGDVAPRALECAEEFRVNTLLARLGFDVGLLCDGSERLGAQHVAEAGDFAEVVCFLLAVASTGAEKPFFAGLRKGQSTWVAPLRALKRRALAVVGALSVAQLGATAHNADGLPAGYAESTLVLARLLTQTMGAAPPSNAEELRAFRRSLEPGARRPPTGRFAPLVLAPSSLGAESAARASLQRRRPATSGATLRYPGRLVLDEQRRAFDGRAPRRGGVVVVDQSGSMDVGANDLAALVRAAPDAIVLGYSHRPGDLGATPNGWLLAAGGRLASTYPAGNVGNGVDGPALRWALSRRRRGEPVVWVSDGQVTDANDHPCEALTRECAELVRHGRIRLVREIGEVSSALRRDRAATNDELTSFGRVGRVLRLARAT